MPEWIFVASNNEGMISSGRFWDIDELNTTG